MNAVKKFIIIDDDDTTCFSHKIFLEEMQVIEDVISTFITQELFAEVRTGQAVTYITGLWEGIDHLKANYCKGTTSKQAGY